MHVSRAAYDEVYAYTMGRPGFILQHVVDAFIVQSATAETKPIGIVFGLIGLYLYLEKGYSGTGVQKVHMELGRRKREWPRLALPTERGAMTADDVLAAPAGPARDQAIAAWCQSVWTACASTRQAIIGLLAECGVNPR